MKLQALAWFMALVAAGGAQAQAGSCAASSGEHTNALVELYTSEGCDSCPPADRWLNDLAKRGTTTVVPIALHVDYWDYLGWKDPYARSAYAVRQREQARLSGGAVVYTPQVMLGGRDYRRWSDAAAFARDVKTINARPARSTITARWTPGGQETVEITAGVTFRDPHEAPATVLHVAVYEDGLVSNVKAGENKGRQLRHERVVREWFGPIAPDAGARIELRRALMLPVRTRIAGVVAFVQHRRTGEILQALDVPSCG